jgi:soluble lytic murein transglycosylase
MHLLLLASALALEPPAHADDGPTVALDPAWTQTSLPLSPQVLADLADRKHTAASGVMADMDTSALSGAQQADHAFVLAWSLIRANKAKQAVDLLPLLSKSTTAPADYLALTRAELLAADGEHVQAAAALADFPTDSVLWPRAMLVRADALRDAGNTADARQVYLDLVERPDPAEGNPKALEALAFLSGSQSDAAYAYDRRLWWAYPSTREGYAAADRLSEYGPFPTWQETGFRGDRMMAAGQYKETIVLLEAAAANVESGTAEACVFRYAHGRSLFKLNRVTEASGILGPAGRDCAGHDADRGAKALYLAGKSLERKKAWAAAAVEYEAISDLFPEHSYADDGLALAGIAWQEAGDLTRARALWQKQVETYPQGDLAGEGYWRLAWGAYLDGDTPQAISWAEQAQQAVPVEVDPVHVRAARYWSARWKAYPDLAAPTVLTADADALEQALLGWEALCRDAPHSYYAQLAASRLQTLAPERYAALPMPDRSGADDPWQVRQVWLDDTHVSNALALLQLGLYREAKVEWATVGTADMTPAEVAVWIQVMYAHDDGLIAHDQFKRYLHHHPTETLGVQRHKILVTAWPTTFWTEVQGATTDYTWDARMFHALVREESNFNKDIVSWAGAIGLSQLMPATARGVARWMGFSVTNSQLRDPATNLKIGARYFESLLERYDGNPYLTLAGYNAGEGNVDKWLTRFGNVPTDHFVESIPFRETRGYVKRVTASYQTYHLVYDAEPATAWPDRTGFLDSAMPPD